MKTFKEQALETVITDLQESKVNFIDNPFRLGSLMYFEVIKEARKLCNEGKYHITEVDKYILETDLGEFEIYDGELVPLDCPMEETEPNQYTDLTFKGLNNEEKDEAEKELNKPQRGGSKKFYVYVRDPQTKNIKKVSWGDTTGLKVKLDDPKARKSFAARHQCDTANDKTSARYWACRLPYYAKQLGLSGGGSFFW